MSQPIRILLVDDDQRMTRTLVDILNLSGFEAEEASSGLEALEKVRKIDFDCVMTDVKMPDMNGVELQGRMKDLRPGLPVILMTAHASDLLIQQGLRDGVVKVVGKPMNIGSILDFFSCLNRVGRLWVLDPDDRRFGELKERFKESGYHWVQQIKDPAEWALLPDDKGLMIIYLKGSWEETSCLMDELEKTRSEMPKIILSENPGLQGFSEEKKKSWKVISWMDAPVDYPHLLEKIVSYKLEELRRLI